MAMRPSVPQYHGPASIAALTMLAGAALIYWSLSGFGIIKGSTPEERKASLIGSIKKEPQK